MRDRRGEEREERRRRFAWWFDRRAGTVGLLIAAVLLTQAGLVYVAVDQIGSNDEPMVVQPAQSSRSPSSPISVDADRQHRVPAPAATRVTETLEAETPDETGVDLAAERAQPRGVAPPLTGNERRSIGARPEPRGPADTPAGQEPQTDPPDTPAGQEPHPDPGSDRAEPGETASDASDPHEHQDGSAEPPAEDRGTQHGRHGHGAQDHEPPGQGGENPGASDEDEGKDEGKDKGKDRD
ncbi:MAG: hypothetical protein KY437_06440 [Actinobacteria bacterium]|nr:hypothetical protein [Actinomycetota bacterium]